MTATNQPIDTAAYRVPHRLVRDYFMLTIVYPTCLQNLKSIRQTNHDLQQKHFFQQLMNLTLTFDPINWTFYTILALIDV